MFDFYDLGLWLYQLAEQQSSEAWNSRDINYKNRCYSRAEKMQSVANVLGFEDRHWQDFKTWRDSE